MSVQVSDADLFPRERSERLAERVPSGAIALGEEPLFDERQSELVREIRRHGLREPLRVARAAGRGIGQPFVLQEDPRRLVAARIAGLAEVPVIIAEGRGPAVRDLLSEAAEGFGRPGRRRIYGTNAERQAAYRARRREEARQQAESAWRAERDRAQRAADLDAAVVELRAALHAAAARDDVEAERFVRCDDVEMVQLLARFIDQRGRVS